jgi:O-antigen/teichoic acid export membrane protein
MRNHWRFIKNATANLGRGSIGAILALLLPPILVRHMSTAAYAVWVLVLQTAGYVSYLNFGLQTAIGRYVAYANEKNDIEQRNSIFSTALTGLCLAALLSLLCLIAAVFGAQKLFPDVPDFLVPQMRIALLLVGISLVIELPASACNGVFIGMERFAIPAIIGGIARLGAAVGVVLAALAGRSLITLAAIISVSNLLSYAAQLIVLRRVAPDVRFERALVRRSTGRELSGYCFGLTVMSFSMLLVTGLDLLLVGRFDFAAVTPYSISATMIAFISGGLFAIVNVIMPHAASLQARENTVEMGSLVISATRISVLILVLTGIPVFVYAESIIRLWIGPQYAEAGAPILRILIVANIIRLVGAAYSVILVAAGQQNFIKVSPLSEGISNFVASIVLGSLFGGIGVALGTLVGSVVSLGAHLWYSMPRTNTVIRFSRRDYLVTGVLRPLLWTCPLILAAVTPWFGIEMKPSVFALIAIVSAAGAGALILRTQRISLG